MDVAQRYELIRPILQRDKTPKQVHQETGVALSSVYRYLKLFREEGMEGLKDKSKAPHAHPKWFTKQQKDLVVQTKLDNPRLSARKIASQLTESGQLEISNKSVTNILHEHSIPLTFSP